jgi:hypothetical protein
MTRIMDLDEVSTQKRFEVKMSPFGTQRWHRALLLFTALFILSVITQFGIGWYQRDATARRDLSEWAENISHELKYSERWDLTHLRQSDVTAGSYLVLDSNGLNIEIGGFVPAMEFRVSLDELPPGLRTVTVPETGETWRLFVKQFTGGTIILGVSSPEDVTNIDKRLEDNMKLFGSSFETALQLNVSDTYRNLEYAVVDINHLLRFAIGGIPLRIVPMKIFPFNKVSEIHAGDGNTYGVFSLPFPGNSARTVGTILTFNMVPPQPWFILQTWIVNCLSSAVLAFLGTLIGIPYIGEKFDPRKLLNHALQNGESQTIEFKEALRWDQWQRTQQLIDESKKKETRTSGEGVAVKTITAFLNNQSGGTLLIGIADDKRIVGLDRDYESLVKRGDRYKDRDRFQLHLRQLLAAKIDRDISNLYIETAIVEVDGKDVCVAHARASAVPIYLYEGNATHLYVRDGASSVQLDAKQTVEYVEHRWPKSFWRRVWNNLRIL